MSSFQPYIDQPYPNYAAEAAAAPYEPGPVEPVAPVAPVEPSENRLADEYPTPSDLLELSRAAREAERDSVERAREERSEEARLAAARDVRRIRDSRAIRELIQSFRDYDNRAAQAAYNNQLAAFVRYGGDYSAPDEGNAVAALRARENDSYLNLGISHAGTVTREIRERMGRAIDRWFVGEGVFMPSMLRYSSSDGFMFSPLTAPARMAERSADVLATYDRSRIAAYLREMAGLAPEDFLFYDPTGLDALALQQRRDFLVRMDQVLREERIDARAAELRYSFNAQNELDVDRLGLENREDAARLDRVRAEINTYYGQLRNSVEQYDAGIISDSMA